MRSRAVVANRLVFRGKTGSLQSEKNATPEEKNPFSPWKRVFFPVASALPEGRIPPKAINF
jgi:hypothetical protein